MKAHKDDNIPTRVALLEQSIDNINQTLIRFEKRFDNLDEKIDKRFDNVEKRMERIDNRLWQIMLLIPGSVIGLVIAKIFHWI